MPKVNTNKMKHIKHNNKKDKFRFNFSINNLFFLALLCILFFSNCNEDTIDPDVFGSLTGQVLFDEDNTPIEGAIISTTPATSTVQSDATGAFVFETIKEGSYTIRAEAPNLVSTVQTITIYENETSNVVILMSEPNIDNTAPSAPSFISPSDNAIGQTISLELSW